MKYTHLFWDFNGTILADMIAGMESTNEMLASRNLPVIPDVATYRELFDFPIKDYYAGLGFDFEKESYEVLAPIWVELYNEKSKLSRLNEGVAEVVAEVRKLGGAQVVFSATEREMLLRQLGELGLMEPFDEIIGLDNIHAESKTHLARKWRAEHPDAVILYVGDTVHDAENARILQADCLLYTGGHQSRQRLARCNFPMIDHITEIMDYLKD